MELLIFHAFKVHLELAKEFFLKYTPKYKGVPNIIYEIFNEPESATWPEVKDYAYEIVSIIRNIDPEALILVGCPHWDQDIDLVTADPLKGEPFTNIAYTVHFYAASHGKWLRDKSTDALESGLAIFISECGGMDSSGQGPVDPVEWNLWVEWMKNNDSSVGVWCIAKMFDTPSASSTISEWGLTVKKILP